MEIGDIFYLASQTLIGLNNGNWRYIYVYIYSM